MGNRCKNEGELVNRNIMRELSGSRVGPRLLRVTSIAPRLVPPVPVSPLPPSSGLKTAKAHPVLLVSA